MIHMVWNAQEAPPKLAAGPESGSFMHDLLAGRFVLASPVALTIAGFAMASNVVSCRTCVRIS